MDDDDYHPTSDYDQSRNPLIVVTEALPSEGAPSHTPVNHTSYFYFFHTQN
jgi:hypothetical protein